MLATPGLQERTVTTCWPENTGARLLAPSATRGLFPRPATASSTPITAQPTWARCHRPRRGRLWPLSRFRPGLARHRSRHGRPGSLRHRRDSDLSHVRAPATSLVAQPARRWLGRQRARNRMWPTPTSAGPDSSSSTPRALRWSGPRTESAPRNFASRPQGPPEFLNCKGPKRATPKPVGTSFTRLGVKPECIHLPTTTSQGSAQRRKGSRARGREGHRFRPDFLRRSGPRRAPISA